ncbi:MAG: hypothetical protein F4X65_13680 [Chloroflexi bacterium]|nr:hypothetical protein [Chloroflexota bacterium]
MPTVDIGNSDPEMLTVLGPTIDIQIGFDPTYRSSQESTPKIPNDLYPALVDTGAMESCIDSSLASELNLLVVDRQTIAGVGGSQNVNVYAAQLYIPSLNYVIYGNFCGVHLAEGLQPHLALIGRTFLRNHTLFYDGRTGVVQLGDG